MANKSQAVTHSEANTELPNPITLDVGGRIFKASHDILCESRLFQHQLSPRYTWLPQADGSYFLDVDPEVFSHLLRFMRRPNLFPLFYSTANGFDIDLYNRLAIEAEYFQLDVLAHWINNQTYLKAITVRTRSPLLCEAKDLPSNKTCATTTCRDSFIARTGREYLCPRRISLHKGRPDMCGAACRKAQGSNDNEYEDFFVIEAVRVVQDILYDDKVCTLP